MRVTRNLLIPMCLLLALPTLAQHAPVNISLVNGDAGEQRAKEQLIRLLATYDIDHWIFTREIRIESMTIPHSHPVLTLSTGLPDDDDHAISTFLHEQFHWYANEIDSITDAAKEEFAERFPNAPAGSDDGGARDLNSTYLHLVVCDLELQAMTILVGEERARAVLESNTHYTWIYDQVLNNPLVRQVNERHGAVVPPGGSASARSRISEIAAEAPGHSPLQLSDDAATIESGTMIVTIMDVRPPGNRSRVRPRPAYVDDSHIDQTRHAGPRRHETRTGVASG